MTLQAESLTRGLSGVSTHAPAFLGLPCEGQGHVQLHRARVPRSVQRAPPRGHLGEAHGGAQASPRGSGWGGDAQRFGGESGRGWFHRRPRPAPGTRCLPPASFLCIMREPPPRRRGGGRGGGGAQGPGAGEAGTSAAAAAAAGGPAAGSRRPACAWVPQGPARRGFWAARPPRGGGGGGERGAAAKRRPHGQGRRAGAPHRGEGGGRGGAHHPAAGPSSKSHRGPCCSGQTDAKATGQARGQPPQPPSHAGSGHQGLLVSGRARGTSGAPF
ncbi:translation initiation factor IF-2-like [Zalophus californianus]|uniref:Translation initiation factor IF-2-like n=1 Tax=Zalophus californianus TaxID=9704 RepID=A0A6P9FH92_ZALCA|nr:translation initiation factor IF-2-like [Zalophus californianus]